MIKIKLSSPSQVQGARYKYFKEYYKKRKYQEDYMLKNRENAKAHREANKSNPEFRERNRVLCQLWRDKQKLIN